MSRYGGRRLWGYWQKAGDMAVGNPAPKRSKPEVYDPRLEQVRAQRQAIYETTILLHTGGRSFRDASGRRADSSLLSYDPTVVSSAARLMFSVGTGVPHRDGRLEPGTQDPTRKTIMESAARYADADHVLRNRQDYEETLAITRQSGFYRVVVEPTRQGLGYFVWPMLPGQDLPVRTRTRAEAERLSVELSHTADPRSTRTWWKPPRRRYTEDEMGYWLPPTSVFSPSRSSR